MVLFCGGFNNDSSKGYDFDVGAILVGFRSLEGPILS